MKLSYEVIVRDKHGRIIHREKGKSRSWLLQYNQMVYGGMSGSAQTVTDITGVGRTQSVTYDLMNIWEIAGDDQRGPVVGSGSTSIAIEDYKLESQISHGTGPGQLDHFATEVIYPSVDGSTCSHKLKKIFHNGSGGTVTVREIGIYCRISSDGNACIARDVLGTDAPVSDGGSITVIYTVRAIVS